MRHIILSALSLLVYSTNLSYATEPLTATQADRELAMEVTIKVQERLEQKEIPFERFIKVLEAKIPSVTNPRTAMILDIILTDLVLDHKRVWDLKDNTFTIKDTWLALDGSLMHKVCTQRVVIQVEGKEYSDTFCKDVLQKSQHTTVAATLKMLELEGMDMSECESLTEGCVSVKKGEITKNSLVYDTLYGRSVYCGCMLPIEYQTMVGKVAIVIPYYITPFDNEDIQSNYNLEDYLIKR